jgi:hypothetical protein
MLSTDNIEGFPTRCGRGKNSIQKTICKYYEHYMLRILDHSPGKLRHLCMSRCEMSSPSVLLTNPDITDRSSTNLKDPHMASTWHGRRCLSIFTQALIVSIHALKFKVR